jgi:hypothetical protein
MVNSIKEKGTQGLALMITKPARSANLVEENNDGDATYTASVRVYSFDHLLIVVDTDRVRADEIAELVSSAAEYTGSIHQAINATVTTEGNGYRVQLPPATDAGFRAGDRAPVHTSRGVLIITTDDGTSASREATRIARELKGLRDDQLS